MIDNLGTPTEHRGVDKNGNPDDKFTEKEALALAKKEGIEFIDKWVVVSPDFNEEFAEFDTQKEAEKALKDHKGAIVIQKRFQKDME